MKLKPTPVTEDTLGDVVFDGNRRRPVVAYKPDGSSVVCAARTAKKNGWVIESKMYARTPAPKPAKASQRKADLDAVEELLGTKKTK